MNATEYQHKFSLAQAYPQYLETGTQEQIRRWTQVYEAARLDDSQKALLAGFQRRMHILIISGIWCGDCVQQCPLIVRIAEAAPEKIDLRLLDRDQHKDLSQKFPINGGMRVPVVLLLAEDFELCAALGDRTLSRYRAFAQRQLGPACPTGLAIPSGDELSATLADWLAEIERVQLMLRLSPRLRQKHGD